MRIVYCEGCSRRICTENVASHLAVSSDEPAYCQNCCPKPVEPILNPELVQRTINEARQKTASGLRKAVSRNRPGSGLHKAVKNLRRPFRRTIRQWAWIAAIGLLFGM